MSWMKRIKRSLRGCTLKPRLKLCSFEEEFAIDLFGFIIALPFLDRFHTEPDSGEIMYNWGAYFYDYSCFVWCWREKTWHFHMPWAWDHCVHEVLRADGTWVPYVDSYEKDKEPDGRLIETAEYQYVLKSGEVQHRTAKFYTDRRIWKWRWFPSLPWPKLVRTGIDVEFSGEVGERTGSWKGGTIGCGFDLQPGETPIACLRRMEFTRKFN